MRTKPIRVLVLDDEVTVRDPLKQALQKEGWTADPATNGAEALKLLEDAKGDYDVAVLDLGLTTPPSGMDVLRIVKLRYPDTECIILTAWGSEDRRQAFEVGAFGYLEKGQRFNYSELRALVKQGALQCRLHAAAREIHAKRSPKEVLERGMSAACSLLGADQAAVVLLGSDDRLEMHRIHEESLPWRQHLREGGLSRDLIASGQVAFFPDTERESAIHPDVVASGVRSFIGVPISVQDQRIGVLYAYSTIPQAFASWDALDALQQLARNVGEAIANAQAFQQVEIHGRHMEILVEAAKNLARATSEEDLLAISWEFVRSQLDISTFYVAFYDSSKDRLSFPLAYDNGEEVSLPDRILGGDRSNWGFTGWVAKTRQEICCHTLDHKRAVCECNGIAGISAGDPCHSCLFIPLEYGDEALGVFSVQAYQPRAFSPALLDTIRALTSQLAIALVNTRLMHLEHRRAQEATILNDAVTEISIPQTRQQLIKTIVGEAVRLFNADGGALYMRDPTGQHLRYVAGKNMSEDLAQGWGRSIDTGLAGLALQDGKPRAVSRYCEWDGRLRELDALHLFAVAVAPVPSGDCSAGALVIHRMEPGRCFDDRDLELLAQMASHAGLALQRTGLLDRLQAIQESALSIGQAGELPEVLRRTCKAAVDLFEADHSGLVLIEPGSDQGVVRGEYPDSPRTMGEVIPITGVPGEERLTALRQPIVCGDVEATRNTLGPVADILLRYDIRSVLIVPIVYQNEVLGSLSLDSVGQLRPFTDDEANLCAVLAAHVAVAIHNARENERERHRSELLDRLEEAIHHLRAETQLKKMLYDTVRMACQLVRYSAGYLLEYMPHLEKFEVIEASGLSEILLEQRVTQQVGKLKQVVAEGRPLVWGPQEAQGSEQLFSSADWTTFIGMPIGRTLGQQFVLVLVGDTPNPHVCDLELDALQRFSEQAASAIRSAQLLNSDQRRLDRLALLHEIGDFMERARDLDAIVWAALTGITAGYGLGFNRGAAFLLDKDSGILRGTMGIGPLQASQAEADYHDLEARHREDFKIAARAYSAGKLRPTPLDAQVRGLQIRHEENALLIEVMQKGRWRLVEASEFEYLPSELLETFDPKGALFLAPLISYDALGLLVADRKFTGAPITEEDGELLTAFADATAVTLQNYFLFQAAESQKNQLRASFEASAALVSEREPEQVLRDIVFQAQKAAEADGAMLVLMDDQGPAKELHATGVSRRFNTAEVADLVRGGEASLSRWVQHWGKDRRIEDAAKHPEANPCMFNDGIRAGLCLPVQLEGGTIGVLWLHYGKPHAFSDAQVDALRLFVNQAAAAYYNARSMRQLKALHKAAQAMAKPHRLKDVLDQLVSEARELLDADSTALWSYDVVRQGFIAEEFASCNLSLAQLEPFIKTVPRRDGTAERVMTNGYLAVSDIRTNAGDGSELGEHTLGLLHQIEAVSFQAVALRVGDEKLGVLYANYTHPVTFGRDDRRALESFALDAAWALKNARLRHQLEQAHQAARMVARVTIEHDLKRTLETVVYQVQEVLLSNSVTIYAYDADERRFWEWATYPAHIPSARSPRELNDHSVVWRMIDSHNASPYFVESDVAADPILGGRFVKTEEVQAAIGVRLEYRGRTVGAMFVNYGSPRRFADEEKENTKLFADLAAVAIVNAQLFSEATERAQAAEALHEAGKAINSTLSLPATLREVAVQALALTGQTDNPATFCNVLLKSGNLLWTAAASDDHTMKRIQEEASDLDLDDPASHRGIVVRAAMSLVTQNVVEVATDFDYRQFDPDTKSELAVPIRQRDRVVGVINVERKSGGKFNSRAVRALESLADQAALATQNARLFEEEQIVAQAARAAASSLELTPFLSALFEQVYAAFKQRHIPVLLSIGALDRKNRTLRTYPTEFYPQQENPRVISLDVRSIMTHVAITEHEYYAHDTKQDKIYRELLTQTRCEYCVPIRYGGELLGVFDLESPVKNAFGFEEQRLVRLIADQIAAMLHTVEQFTKMREIRALVGTKTADEWMRLVAADWDHAIGKLLSRATTEVSTAQTAIRNQNSVQASNKLSAIADYLSEIGNVAILVPLSKDDLTAPIGVNAVISDKLAKWKATLRDKPISLEQRLQADLDNLASVWASSAWLWRAVAILLDNSVDAMMATDRMPKSLIISTALESRFVVIRVQDSGPGIQEEIQARFGVERIDSTCRRGAGVGAQIAALICEVYGGDLKIESTSAMGTTIRIRLPVGTKSQSG